MEITDFVYHVITSIFCLRYWQKLFRIDGVEVCSEKLVCQICERNEIDILAMECQSDYCYLFVNVPSVLCVAKMIQIIKINTSRVLREVFVTLFRMPHLWTCSCFASTAGSVSSKVIRRYVESQKH